MAKPSNNNNAKLCLWLGIAVFAVYGNSLFNGFVWDDGYLILNNPFIKSLAHLKDVFFNDVTVMTPLEKASGYYRPFSLAFLMLSYKLWGLNSVGLHLNNILLHFFNVLFVFFIVRKITGEGMLSFLTALLFAIHPIHVEAVTPIYNCMGVLSAFFALGSLLFFIKTNEIGEYKNRYFFVSSVFLFLAVFSKEEALMMPAVFLLYDFYFIAKFRLSEMKRRLGQYLVFFVVCAGYLIMRLNIVEKEAVAGLWSLDPQTNFNVMPAASGLLHVLTVLKIYALYAGFLIFPTGLSAFHIIWPVNSVMSTEAVALLMAFTALCCFVILKRKSPAAFFVIVFFVSSFLVSNIIPIGGLFAERLIYFPSLTYCFMLPFIFLYGIQGETKLAEQGKRTAAIIFAGILILYGLQTVARNYVWRNNVSLWSDAAQKSPGALVYLNLAMAYQDQQRYHEAVEAYRAALRYPTFKKVFIHNEIGKIYGDQTLYTKALEEFNKALQLNDRFAETYYNIGITYFNQGDEVAAESYFEKSIQMANHYPWPYYGLGLVYKKRGDMPKSREMFKKVLEVDPNFKLAKNLFK